MRRNENLNKCSHTFLIELGLWRSTTEMLMLHELSVTLQMKNIFFGRQYIYAFQQSASDGHGSERRMRFYLSLESLIGLTASEMH